MLVAEVQTPSDTTYRVYDFDRIDPRTGQPRQLHVAPALECIDFASAGKDPHPPVSGDGVLVAAPQFTVEQRSAEAGDVRELGSGRPIVLVFLEGQGQVTGPGFEPVDFRKGQTLLLPADLSQVKIEASAPGRWLETTFPG